MSAVFEVHLAYKRNISFLEITDILKENDVSYSIESIECMDNWEYDNHQKLNNQSIKDIDILIQNQKKIFVIVGLVNSMYRSGINFSRGEGNQYCLDFWISTKGLEQLDSNYLTDTNIELYNKLKIQLTKHMNKSLLILCGIGSEVLIPDLLCTEDIIANSKNVCMWILPNEEFDETLNKYEKQKNNNFFVYSLKI